MKAKVNFDGEWLSDSSIESHEFTFKERLKRGLRAFIMFFGLTLGSIFIPVLHFVLVPGFLIISIFAFYRKFHEMISVDLKDISCPSCRRSLNSKVFGLKKNDFSIRLYCNDCRKTLTVMLDQKLV